MTEHPRQPPRALPPFALSLVAPSQPAEAAARPATGLLALAAAVMTLAGGLAWVLGGGPAAEAAAAADPALTGLLRFMAGMKASLALGALGLLGWRLALAGRPAPRALGGWLLALGLMAAGPVLIWRVGTVGTGALAFHTGLALLVLTLAWLDRAAIAGALARRVAAGRATRRKP
jgi:hypothetical protein